MPKPYIEEVHLGELSEDHKEYLYDFLHGRKNRETYSLHLKEFFRFMAYRNKNVTNEIDDNDLRAYIQEIENFKIPTRNTRYSSLRTFKSFLHNEYPEKFKENYLQNIPSDGKADGQEKGRVFSLFEISMIRKFNSTDRNIRISDTIIFEFPFQIPKFRKQDFDNKIFLETIITDYQNLDYFYTPFKKSNETITVSKINGYFERLTKHLLLQGVYQGGEREVTYYDITKSHDAYFITCPNCGLQFECTDVNWCFAKLNFDKEYHLVCRQCKGQSDINEN
jgi:hypothetical protein